MEYPNRPRHHRTHRWGIEWIRQHHPRLASCTILVARPTRRGKTMVWQWRLPGSRSSGMFVLLALDETVRERLACWFKVPRVELSTQQLVTYRVGGRDLSWIEPYRVLNKEK